MAAHLTVAFAAREGSQGRTNNSDSEGTPTPGPPAGIPLGRGQWDVASPAVAGGGEVPGAAASELGRHEWHEQPPTPSTLYSKRSMVPKIAAASRAPPHVPKLPLSGSAWQMYQDHQQHLPLASERRPAAAPARGTNQAPPAADAAPSHLAAHLRDIHANLQSNMNQMMRPRASPGRSPRLEQPPGRSPRLEQPPSPPGLPVTPRTVATLSSPATGKVLPSLLFFFLLGGFSCLCSFHTRLSRSGCACVLFKFRREG
jgi:hypothetical protein